MKAVDIVYQLSWVQKTEPSHSPMTSLSNLEIF